jgi:uncharacterized protein DUF5908
MPIEIRELVIRAAVTAPPRRDEELELLLARLKSEILQECEARLQERLARDQER